MILKNKYFKDWSGNSLDLTPIDNLWAIMKHRIRGHDASSDPNLTTVVMQIWEDLSREWNQIIENLPLSVSGRLEEVEHKKRPSKY